jgi:peptidoglycan/LPS O-acetylase OafA/YrhL
VLGILGVTLACGAHRLSVVPADYIFGLLTIFLLWGCLCSPLKAPSSSYALLMIALSDFSYTLYVTHVPFLRFLKVVWLGSETWRPDLAHLCLAAVPFLAAIGFAYGCSLIFESNTDRVRRFILAKLKLSRESRHSFSKSLAANE